MTATECQIKINKLDSELQDIYEEIDDYNYENRECTDPTIVNTVHRPHVDELLGQWQRLHTNKLKLEKVLKLLTINTEDDDTSDKVDWKKVHDECGIHVTDTPSDNNNLMEVNNDI